MELERVSGGAASNIPADIRGQLTGMFCFLQITSFQHHLGWSSQEGALVGR